MTKEVDYYFDCISPAAYLSWARLPALIEEAHATVNYKPMLLGGVFKETGNSSPITVPAKGAYVFNDFHRWAKRFDVPFTMNDKFPINSLYLMRGIIAYKDDLRFMALTNAIFDGMWVSNKDLNDSEVVAQVVSTANVDPVHFVEAVNDPLSKQSLIEATDEAISRGVFGAPTFFVDGEMFWGQTEWTMWRKHWFEVATGEIPKEP